MGKATIPDIAARAGLSTATVDRALNGRRGVSAANRHRVLKAAEDLGYLPSEGMVMLPSRPAHLVFLIPFSANAFMRDLARSITAFSAGLPLVASCNIVTLEGLGSDALERGLEAVSPQTNGVGLVCTDEPRTRAAVDRLCEAAILALCLAWPELVADAAHGLESLECADPEHRALLAALLRHAPGLAGNPDALRAALVGECGTRTLEKLDATGHLAVVPALLPGADPALARRTLDHEIARLAARRGARCEIGHAMEDFADPQGEGLTWRLREAAAALNGPATPVADPAAGAAAEQSALSARLQALIDGEVWVKGKPAK